ncbi:MAG: hypothetical protein J5J06_08775 [Phycisphaerae bacterium]|nr:hypothetical protein [Phycisphaerae bacterium]
MKDSARETSPPRLTLAHTRDGESANQGGEVRREAVRASRPRAALRVLAAVVLSLAVGAVVTLWGPFEYLCGATLAVTPDSRGEEGAADGSSGAVPSARGSFAAREHLRQVFMDHAWRRLGPNLPESGGSMKGWYVETTESGELQLGIRTTNRELAVEQARGVAESFVRSIRETREAQRSTPSAGEAAIGESVDQLQRRLASVEMGLEQTQTSLPEGDPTDAQKALLDRWNKAIGDYRAAKSELSAAALEAARLGRLPMPTQGLPTGEERKAAQLADEALQQDLRELGVNLAELRRELLDVSARCADSLTNLRAAVGQLLPAAQRFEEVAKASGVMRDSGFGDAVKAYAGEVERFAVNFQQDREALAGVPDDPLLSHAIETHEALRSESNRFLFESGKRLSEVRSSMREATESGPDVTAFHISQSDVARAFQVLQQEHHRLEFALVGFEPRDNFRIDSAVRSAKGLLRRCQDRIERLDDVLSKKALERARSEHTARLASAEHRVETLRGEVDAAVAELLDIQSDINVNIGAAQSYLRSSLRAQLLEEQAGTAREDLARLGSTLTQLEKERLASATGADVELLHCGVLDGPVDLPRRLQLGGIAGIAALFATLAGQWLLRRRV